MFKKLLPFILFLFIFNSTKAQDEFITIWKPGVTQQTTVPGRGTNFKVYWEEIGYTQHNATMNNVSSTREFTINFGTSLNPNPSNATYRVKISDGEGVFDQIRSFDPTLVPFYNWSDRQKFLEITQWGNIKWKGFEQAFVLCNNLDITALDAPDLSLVTNTNEMFYICSSLVGNPSFNTWNTSHITIMTNMFANADSFNQPVGNWDVSNVTNMYGLFDYATSFNQPLNNWNTSSVTSMEHTFHGAFSFNQDLRNWNTSNVTNMEEMFHSATAFNQNLGYWNLSSLTEAKDMFLDSGMSCQNYDNTLYAWSMNAATSSNVNLGNASPLKYSHPLVVNARNHLISNKGWTITGDIHNEGCNSVLATSETSIKNDITIYPNPANDFIYVKNLKGNSTYKIFDLSGRIIQQDILNDEKINVSNLMSGNYILQIISKDKTQTLKFIKK
ncbi:BspA family leucine-rich repeat surface protein [Chryseobacterium polytrichastri]|uniref:Por secretion system C-terminal sorting domain-containing protein n=1 Tax=Chryseobacterium polytrichastri TaxID=1302687 RepID=A0A1M7D906_9FLAO|nr:BspA family leucine-rich repeat surface protein [Chryseobacterium polytrichastri]SHL75982.1 Por secretion system C-terminal sorting domain-containing protein [Chryseobacterium polytrichastri]